MATLSTGERATLLALELIQRQLVQLTVAVASNAAGTAPRAGGTGGPPQQPRRNLLGRATDLLVGRFTALLGPLATFATYLSAPTSGLSVFNKAMGLFAASIAPLLLPVLFTLAVGLAASSDVIFRKLVPALESFDRAVLSVGIPAVVQLAETCGRAADAIAQLSKTPAAEDVKAATGASASSWVMSVVNPLGRILESRTATDTIFAPAAIARSRAATDTLFPAFAVGRRLFGGSGGGGAGSDAGALGAVGAVVGGGSDGARAVDKARLDALRELQLAMLPKVSVGAGGQSTYDRALQAASGSSPWERDMLVKVGEVVTILSRALEGGGGTGTLTDDERRRVDRTMEEARRGRR